MDTFAPPARFRALVIAGLATGMASLAIMAWTLGETGSRTSRATAAGNPIAALAASPRTAELTSEKATRVREAIRRGDFSTAHRIVDDVLTKSALTRWHYHPFERFIVGTADVTDLTFLARLNEWVAQSDGDALPHLIRAQYYTDRGWLTRGSRFANQVQASAMASFENDMTDAMADIDAAIRINDRIPYAYYLRLRILQGFGTSQAMNNAFEQAIAKHPGYFRLYVVALRTLEPKWGGTPTQMYAFVDKHAGTAPEHSPLKLLYLELYGDLLSTASTACGAYRLDRDQLAQCIMSNMKRVVTPELEKNVLMALQLYDHADKYDFGIAVETIISQMLQTTGAELYSGAILQLAATSMHSDTQLKQQVARHGDYIIDKLAAASWFAKGFNDNALTKYRDALRTIETTAFPDEEAKDLAVAGIYEEIARVHNKLHQYADMIAAERTAVEIGNLTQLEHFICYGYYQLKRNDDALPACDQAVAHQPGNLYAHYWRGYVLRDMGRADDALRDLTLVADSDSAFRSGAVIDMSMIHFNRNDNQAALDLLNKYTYLYDPAKTSRSSVAVGFNNRCYAYMELGELRKALDDCTQSLKYGSLPDAYRKQQELVKRLGGT